MRDKGFRKPKKLDWGILGFKSDKLVTGQKSGLIGYRYGSYMGDKVKLPNGEIVEDARNMAIPLGVKEDILDIAVLEVQQNLSRRTESKENEQKEVRIPEEIEKVRKFISRWEKRGINKEKKLENVKKELEAEGFRVAVIRKDKGSPHDVNTIVNLPYDYEGGNRALNVLKMSIRRTLQGEGVAIVAVKDGYRYGERNIFAFDSKGNIEKQNIILPRLKYLEVDRTTDSVLESLNKGKTISSSEKEIQTILEKSNGLKNLGYEIVDFIGSGDNGVIFKVLDKNGQVFTLKIFAKREEGKRFNKHDSVWGSSIKNQFKIEKERLDNLKGTPYIPQIFEAGEIEKFDYYVTEYFDGVDLRTLQRSGENFNIFGDIAEGNRTNREGAAILAEAMKQIIEANIYMEARGIDHKNEPRNVMVRVKKEGNKYKVSVLFIDFGDSRPIIYSEEELRRRQREEQNVFVPISIENSLQGLINDKNIIDLEKTAILSSYEEEVSRNISSILAQVRRKPDGAISGLYKMVQEKAYENARKVAEPTKVTEDEKKPIFEINQETRDILKVLSTLPEDAWEDAGVDIKQAAIAIQQFIQQKIAEGHDMKIVFKPDAPEGRGVRVYEGKEPGHIIIDMSDVLDIIAGEYTGGPKVKIHTEDLEAKIASFMDGKQVIELKDMLIRFLMSLPKNKLIKTAERINGTDLFEWDGGDIYVEDYMEGSSKHVFKLKIQDKTGSAFDIAIATKIEKERGSIKGAEIKGLKHLQKRPTKVVPVIGDVFYGGGRRWYIEEFIEGNLVEDLQEKNKLPKSLRQKIIATLLSIAVGLNGVVPRDVHGANFVESIDTGEIIMVDIGNTRLHVTGKIASKEPKENVEKHRELFMAILMAQYGFLEGKPEDNHFIFDSIINDKSIPEGEGIEWIRQVGENIKDQSVYELASLFVNQKYVNHFRPLFIKQYGAFPAEYEVVRDEKVVPFAEFFKESLLSYLDKLERGPPSTEDTERIISEIPDSEIDTADFDTDEIIVPGTDIPGLEYPVGLKALNVDGVVDKIMPIMEEVVILNKRYEDILEIFKSFLGNLDKGERQFVMDLLENQDRILEMRSVISEKARGTFSDTDQIYGIIDSSLFDTDEIRTKISIAIFSFYEDVSVKLQVQQETMKSFDVLIMQLFPDEVSVYRSVSRKYAGLPGLGGKKSYWGVGERGLKTAGTYRKPHHIIINSTFGELRKKGVIIDDYMATIGNSVVLIHESDDVEVDFEVVEAVEDASDLTGNIAKGYTEEEEEKIKKNIEQESDDVCEENRDIAKEVEKRVSRMLDTYRNKIEDLLVSLMGRKDLGVTIDEINEVVGALANPKIGFAWFYARVENKEKYFLGHKNALAVNIIRYLEKQEERYDYDDLIDEYILHEALEKIKNLSHENIIKITREFFNRDAEKDKNPLKTFLRDFIDDTVDANKEEVRVDKKLRISEKLIMESMSDPKTDFYEKINRGIPVEIYGARDAALGEIKENGKDISYERLEREGYAPAYGFKIGKDVIYLSKPFLLDGNSKRPAFIAYNFHKESKEGEYKLFVNSFYKSNSQAVWRVVSHELLEAFATVMKMKGWLGKGINEFGQTLPVEIQDKLENILLAEKEPKIDETIFYAILGRGTTEGPLASEIFTQKEMIKKEKEIIITKGDNPIGRDFSFVEGYEPNFANVVDRYKSVNSIYGEIEHYAVLSKNEEIQYLFNVDADGRIWIGTIQAVGIGLTRQGTRADTVILKFPKYLLMPAYEYPKQIPYGYAGETHKKNPSYADATDYHNKIGIIKEFREKVLESSEDRYISNIKTGSVIVSQNGTIREVLNIDKEKGTIKVKRIDVKGNIEEQEIELADIISSFDDGLGFTIGSIIILRSGTKQKILDIDLASRIVKMRHINGEGESSIQNRSLDDIRAMFEGKIAKISVPSIPITMKDLIAQGIKKGDVLKLTSVRGNVRDIVVTGIEEKGVRFKKGDKNYVYPFDQMKSFEKVDITGNIAKGYSTNEVEGMIEEITKKSDDVRNKNKKMVGLVHEKSQSLISRWKDIKSRLEEKGVPQDEIDKVHFRLLNPNDFSWFEAKVELGEKAQEKYFIGNKSALAVNIIEFLKDWQKRSDVPDNLLDEYILHEALENIPDAQLDHEAVIELTSELFENRELNDDQRTPLGQALRDFIDVKLDAEAAKAVLNKIRLGQHVNVSIIPVSKNTLLFHRSPFIKGKRGIERNLRNKYGSNEYVLYYIDGDEKSLLETIEKAEDIITDDNKSRLLIYSNKTLRDEFDNEESDLKKVKDKIGEEKFTGVVSGDFATETSDQRFSIVQLVILAQGLMEVSRYPERDDILKNPLLRLMERMVDDPEGLKETTKDKDLKTIINMLYQGEIILKIKKIDYEEIRDYMKAERAILESL